MKRKIIALMTIIAVASSAALAQTELSSFTATGRAGVSTSINTDYQAIGINPANLGLKPRYENKKITIGIGEFAGNVYAQGVTVSDISKYFAGGLSKQDQMTAVSKFANQQFSINADLTLLGIGVNTGKLGGFAFSIRDQFRYSHKMSQGTSDFLFRGATSIFMDSLILNNNSHVVNDPSQYATYDATGIKAGISSAGFSLGQVTNGSYVKSQWYREYNLSYGKTIINKEDEFSICGGIGVKYLQGIQYINISAENNKLTGVASFSPIMSLSKSLNNISTSYSTTSSNFSPTGGGVGMDIGVTATVRTLFTFAASVVNIGSVVYKHNAYTMHDSIIHTISYPNSGIDVANSLMVWKGVDKIKVGLPTMFRAGGSINLLNKLVVGLDFVAPLNQNAGNLTKPLVALGGDFYPVRWFKISSGMYMGGNTANKANIPLGITIIAGENGTYEFGFATRDIVTYMKPKSPSYSFAMGLLRFRF